MIVDFYALSEAFRVGSDYGSTDFRELFSRWRSLPVVFRLERAVLS